MASHAQKEYSWTEAVEIVSCSPSTLRRKLNQDGVRLGATKLKRGWRIPVTTLEALGVLNVVNSSDEQSGTVREQSSLREENTRLRIENATLRTQNDGLRQLLAEREKVVALLESRPARKEHWWNRLGRDS